MTAAGARVLVSAQGKPHGQTNKIGNKWSDTTYRGLDDYENTNRPTYKQRK